MKRFAIEIVRGNDTRLFGTYDTKEQGYEVGKSYAQALAGEGGVIILFRGEFDEKNNRLSNESRIYEIWDVPKAI
jgi:hypothetical protein